MEGDAGPSTGGGWTCPVCFFYCQRDWLVCPVCDYVRPADLPMDDEVPGSGFCVIRAACGLSPV
jgi:hypothetical protein